MKRPFLAVGAVALVIAVQAVPASAHLKRHRDPDDRAGADLRWVELRRTHHGRRLVFDVGTGQDRPSWARFRVFFDTTGDRRADYYLTTEYDSASSGLINGGFFHANGDPTDAKVRHRPSSSQSWFPVWMRWERLHATRHIRWRVTMRNLNTPPPKWLDRAPQDGWYAH
jgi:hypothetical protein